MSLDNDGFSFLVDGNNNIVAYQDEKLSQQPLTELNPLLSADKVQQLVNTSSISTVSWPEQGDKLIFVANVPHTDWSLGIVVDKDMAFASV